MLFRGKLENTFQHKELQAWISNRCHDEPPGGVPGFKSYQFVNGILRNETENQQIPHEHK